MAKGGITLDVGTKYNGEGLKKLDQDLKSASTSVKKVGGSVLRVASQFEELGGEAGKAAGKISGIFASIAEGGVKMAAVSIIISGATKAVQSLFEYLNKTNEAVKKVQESFKEGLATSIKKVTAEISKFGNTYNTVIGRKTNLQSIDQTTRNEELKRMEYDRKDANTMIDGVSKSIVDRDYVEKIENKKVANAKADVTDIQNRIRWVEKAIETSLANEKRTKDNWSSYNEASLTAGANGDYVKQAEYFNEARYSKEENAKWVENTKKYQQELEKLKVDEVKAEQSYITQKRAADSAILAADKAKAKVFQEIQEKLNQQEAKKLEVESKIKETENAEIKKQQEQEITKLNDEINALASAITNLRDISKNGQVDNQKNPWKIPNRDEIKQQNQRNLQQKAADQLAERVFDRNGKIRQSTNTQDIDKMLGMVHDGANLTDKLIEGLAKKRDELQTLAGFNNRKMTDKQKNQLAKLNDLLKKNDAEKKMKQLQQEKDQKQKEMMEDASKRTADVKKIREKIEQLGL